MSTKKQLQTKKLRWDCARVKGMQTQLRNLGSNYNLPMNEVQNMVNALQLLRRALIANHKTLDRKEAVAEKIQEVRNPVTFGAQL